MIRTEKETALLIALWEVIAIIIVAGILFIISGCATYPYPHETHYSLDGWKVVYADPDSIRFYCRDEKLRGCTITAIKTMFCPIDNYWTCGHELRHVTEGGFH